MAAASLQAPTLRAPAPALRSARAGGAHRGRASLTVRAAADGPQVRWSVMQQTLKAADIRSIAVNAVEQARVDGFALVDVRPAAEFDEYHAPGAISVPLFGPIVMDSPGKMMKQFLYSMNGMKGTDENPRFLEELAAAVPSKSNILVMCDSGGSYRPVGATLEGRRSRSLVAIYKILTAGGFANVYHVGGGIREWGEQGLEMEGTSVESWASTVGKMPRA